VLTVANVAKLRKIREFAVDDKIDVTPLVVGDRLYVFTMTNTAYIFDVNTGAQLAKPRQLAAPFDPLADDGEMDRHDLYRTWGITATRSATTCCGSSTRARLPTSSRRY
jgi:hypothetical protein